MKWCYFVLLSGKVLSDGSLFLASQHMEATGAELIRCGVDDS